MTGHARRRRSFLRPLLGTPTGLLGLVLLVGLVALASVAPSIWGDEATTTDYTNLLAPSSSEHPFGTDPAGRDVLARTMVATRQSLVLSLGAVALASAIGVGLGAVLVSVGGRAQRWGATVVDTWLGFPSILISVLIITATGPGAGAAVLAIGLSFAPFFARITMTAVASVAGLDYVAAARLLGLSRGRILRRYLLSNVAENLTVAAFATFGQCLIAISALSFLGLGVQPEAGAAERFSIDWGVLLNQGLKNFRQVPEAALGPMAFIAIAGLALGWFGDGVARLFNPRLVVRSATSGTSDVPTAEAAT